MEADFSVKRKKNFNSLPKNVLSFYFNSFQFKKLYISKTKASMY